MWVRVRRLTIIALLFTIQGASAVAKDPPSLLSERDTFFTDFQLGVSSGSGPSESRGWQTPPKEPFSQKLLVVPRVVLAIPKFVLNLIFQPLLALGRVIQKHAVIEHVMDFLYNDSRTLGIVPTAKLASGVGLSGGAKLKYKSKPHGKGGNEAHLETRWGKYRHHFYEAAYEGKVFEGMPIRFSSRARLESYPLLRFYGYGDVDTGKNGPLLGPRDSNVFTRYREDRFLAVLKGEIETETESEFLKPGFSLIYNDRDYAGKIGNHNPDPSIEKVYNPSQIKGFSQNVKTLEVTGDLELDFVDYPGQPSEGHEFSGFFGGVPTQSGIGYFHYGFEEKVFINLYRKNRVLLLRGMLEAVDGSEERLPFFALPRLGGANRLRGYPTDRFRDERVGVGTLEYHYPVHQYVMGELFFEGGTFSKTYSDLGSDWKFGGGFGFLIGTKEDLKFKLDFAYGDGYQFSLSLNPTEAFYRRERQL